MEEEQKRGITMKAANISLYYEHSLKNAQAFVINLVDTPGHLDFSGKVTRALRLVDGVVVIVDAVEEVSSQTETVVRQALEEAARPILFINKIDRLFNELKLDIGDIKTKIARIIQSFNQLIEMYGFEQAKTNWKVSAEKGSVIFGSALHRWGFSVPQLKKQNHTFNYFYDQYKNKKSASLVKEYPVWEAVLGAVVEFLPNPVEAQAYRIPVIWKGDVNSTLGKAMINCDANGPLIICLSKVQMLKGRLIGTGRVYSGTLKHSSNVLLINEKEIATINQVSIFMGARMEVVQEIPAGNIAAIGGVSSIRAGETLVDPDYVNEARMFESVKYVSEPVVTMAVEPEMLKDLNQLQEILEEIKIEDPNIKVEISSETGECLVSGMGPLHLETIGSAIKERGISVTLSKPTSVFRESVLKSSNIHEAISPNGQNKIHLILKRLDKDTVKYFREIKSNILENRKLREVEIPAHTSLTKFEARGIWKLDDNYNLIISRLKEDTGIDYDVQDKEIASTEIGLDAAELKETGHNQEKKQSNPHVSSGEMVKKVNPDIHDQLIKAIHGIILRGPLAQENFSELCIIIKDIQIASENENVNFFELSTMINQAFGLCLKQAKPILLEPIYRLMITSPPEYIGTVSSLINQFQGKIQSINQDPFRAFIEARMAVRHSIEFSQSVRSETAARVFWQSLFDCYEPVTEAQQDQIIRDIKFRKGLLT
jgi:elongation factor 2